MQKQHEKDIPAVYLQVVICRYH